MAKNQDIELDVDFIGSQEPLTISEEKALSDFFKKKKELKKRQLLKKSGLGKKVMSE